MYDGVEGGRLGSGPTVFAPSEQMSVRRAFERTKAALVRRFQFGLFAQGYVLIANQLVAAGLGIVYWAAAGHLYSSSDVGRAASALSLIMLISLIAELGVKGMFVRYIPALGRERRAFILASYLAIVVVATVLARLAVEFDVDRFFNDVCDGDGCKWFAWAAIVVTIFYVQDGVLIAQRRSWLVLTQSATFNATKLVLIVILGYFAVHNAILVSWFAPIPVFILIGGLVIFRDRRSVVADAQRVKRDDYSTMVKQTAWYYLSGLVNEVAGRVLPLIIFERLGGSSAAYFFQAWLIAGTLRFLSTSLASSFTVEMAENPAALATSARKALFFMTGVTVLAAAAVNLFAPLILRIIGAEYAENAAPILRLLALSAIPYSISIWMASYARLAGSGRCILVGNVIQSVACIGLASIWIGPFGLTGVGIACLLAQTLALAPCYGLVVSALRSPDLASGSRSQFARDWRRLDWRFLLRNPWPKSAACDEPAIAKDLALLDVDLLPLSDARGDRELVVLRDTARSSIAHARRALGPAGELVWVGPAYRLEGARRRLRDAGFEIQSIFLGVPAIRRANIFIPLPARPETVAFALSHKFSAPSERRARLCAIAARVIAAIVNQRLIGGVALMARAGHADISTVVDDAFHAHAMNGLVAMPGSRVDSAICAFAWTDAGVSPAFVVKRARNVGGDQLVMQEARILALLEARFRPPAHLAAPRLACMRVVADHVETSQSYLAGVQIDRTKFDFVAAAALVSEFQMVLGVQTMTPHAGERPAPLDLVSHLRSAGLLDDDEAQCAASRLARLTQSPCVLTHNDFTPWNALLDGDKLGVIDWGEGEEHGYPGVDLACMLFHLAFAAEGAESREATVKLYAETVAGEGAYASIVDQRLREYLAALRLDETLAPELRLMTWLYRSVCELRLVEAETGDAGREALPVTSVMLALLRAELETTPIDWRTPAIAG